MKRLTALWENRIRLLGALRPAGPALLSGFFIALLANALMPAAFALVLGSMVAHITIATGDVLSAIFAPLAAFAGVLLLGQLAEVILEPLEYLVVNRIDGAHRAALSQMIAAVPTIEVLEQSSVQAMIREVEADPRNGYERTPGQGAAALLRWLTGLVGIVFSGLVLASYAWWLPVLLILPAALNSLIRDHQNVVVTRLWQHAVAGELHADVWREATVAPGPGKETRVFGLSTWMVNRMQGHIAAANLPLWNYINRLLLDEWSQLVLVVLGLVPAYVVVTMGVLAGTTTLALQMVVLSAGAAVYRDLAGSTTMHTLAGGAAVLETMERLKQKLHAPVQVATAPSQPAVVVLPQPVASPPHIVFDEVTFRYPQASRAVLQRLTLEIAPGEALALVGLNGSGKSTIVKLLSGLYTPTSGHILIDGRDLSEMDLAAWRARLAVVFQDFIHYPLSARENVALTDPQTTTTFLDTTTLSSGISGVIERLPQGWDTPLSRARSTGVDLSGGQWQQVALARALHRVHAGAGLLVLDEPTAHLDVRTEAEVFGSLAGLSGRVGQILISHRLATVRNADRIVLLADGQIKEAGTHDELMALHSQYQRMFSLQARRFAQGYDDRIEEGEWL